MASEDSKTLGGGETMSQSMHSRSMAWLRRGGVATVMRASTKSAATL